jgi:hypothetical protein
MYSYKDISTGKLKHTRGKFAGWTPRQGPLQIPYAVFQNSASAYEVPFYLLTKETLARLPKLPPSDKP